MTVATSTPRRWAGHAQVLALAVVGSLAVVSCGGGSASETTVSTDALAPTVPGAPTMPTTTLPATTLPATTTTELAFETTTLAPTTTIAHGPGIVTTTNTGTPIPGPAIVTAQHIYDASIRRDYARLAEIIGDRRFKWGFVGQHKPAEQWRKDFDEGKGDQIRRIVTLLETRPGIDKNGNAVWPYLAVKDPEEWTPDDQTVAAALGFSKESIAQTVKKGRYLEYRLVITAKGTWTGLYLGA